jgi:hypothetical protein
MYIITKNKNINVKINIISAISNPYEKPKNKTAVSPIIKII